MPVDMTGICTYAFIEPVLQGEAMITATFTQFRNNAASYFDKVEKGEAVQIYRNGKPSAMLVKPGTKIDAKTYWKNAKPILDLGGDSAVRMLLEERRNGR